MPSRSFLLVLPAILALGIGVGSFPARSQTVTTDAMVHKLSTPVHLASKVITLAELSRQIEQQTGASIHPAESLLAHKMLLKASGWSAAALLNTLSEIYGWQWRETAEGIISIDRPTVRTPESFMQVSQAVRLALSPQLLRYIGDTEGATPTDPAILPGAHGIPPMAAPRHRAIDRFPMVERQDDIPSRRIWPSIPARMQPGSELPYAEWEPADRGRVLESLLGRVTPRGTALQLRARSPRRGRRNGI